MLRKALDYLVKVIRPWEEYDLNRKEASASERFRILLKKLYLWSQRGYAIRCVPALEYINSHRIDTSILEVGAGPLGISRYTKKKIIGIDISVAGPHYENISLVNSDAASLPFRDNTFALVLSLDMLEHIPKHLRQNVIAELLRVSRGSVLLGMPSGVNAERIEEKCRKVYDTVLHERITSESRKSEFIRRNTFLSDHYRCGLPKEEEIRTYIDNCMVRYPYKFKVGILDNESIYVWYYWVLAMMKYNYLRWFVTTAVFILFFPVLSRIKWGGCYRKIFIIERVF